VEDEEFYLLGYNALYFIENKLILRRNISSPSPGPKISQGGKLHEAGSKQSPASSILKMETTFSSETSVYFQ
jgi:hypothetical protein